MKTIKLSLFISLFLLAACSSTEPQKEQSMTPALDDAQLKALLVGKTMSGRGIKSNKIWATTIKTNGVQTGTSPKGEIDVGTYTFKNNRYCRTWKTWRDGTQSCWTIHKKAKGYYGKLVSGNSNSFDFAVK